MFELLCIYLHKPFGPMISTEFECSFSLDAIVSPPIIMTNELTSFSIGHILINFQMKIIIKLLQNRDQTLGCKFMIICRCTSLSQTVISSFAPSQLPIPGSFSRVLFIFPPPQLFVHSLHWPHVDHSQPNTWPRWYMSMIENQMDNQSSNNFNLNLVESTYLVIHYFDYIVLWDSRCRFSGWSLQIVVRPPRYCKNMVIKGINKSYKWKCP